MEVTQTLSEGLKREFKVVLAAQELQSRLDGQIAEMKDKVQLKGFRPGKVPVAHLKKLYGRSIVADIVNKAIGEAETKIVDDNSLRFAVQPKIDLPTDKEAMEKVLDLKTDFAFTLSGEVLPKVEVGSLDDLTLERPVAAVSEEDVDNALKTLVDRQRSYTPAAESDEAADGDQLTIDFTGKIDGEPFEGGTGSDVPLVLGSKAFLPGFEEQLVGAKADEARTVNASFPADYPADNLAGKDAVFDVTVKAIAHPEAIEVGDEFAKGYGSESLADFRDAIRKNIEADFARASRMKIKRKLLDTLDERYDFALPEGLVEQEFANIWRQVEMEHQQAGRTFADDDTTEEAAREDFRRIAERRVRLGLVLGAIGESSNVTVGQDEVQRALIEQVRRFPGQEKEVWELYQKNPQLAEQLRAPIFEDKVVDLVVERAKVNDKTVSREELFKPDDDELPKHGKATQDKPAGGAGAAAAQEDASSETAPAAASEG